VILKFNNSQQARLLAELTGDLVQIEEAEIKHPTLDHMCMLVGSVRDGGRTKLWLRLEEVSELTSAVDPIRRPPIRMKKKPPPMRQK